MENKILENWKAIEEMKKCKESPLYFYNTYMLKEGQRPLIQQEYDLLVKQVELYSNSVPIRMRRGNYIFMKPIVANELPEYFDGSNITTHFLDECRQMQFPRLWPKQQPQSDLEIATELARDAELVFKKPIPKYYMGVDSGALENAAFVVMRKDGEVMQYGNGKNDETFKAEVEKAAKHYNINPSEILKETN